MSAEASVGRNLTHKEPINRSFFLLRDLRPKGLLVSCFGLPTIAWVVLSSALQGGAGDAVVKRFPDAEILVSGQKELLLPNLVLVGFVRRFP